MLNGWQHIWENNQNKAFGTQVQFKPSSRCVFNSSTFVGNEQPTGTPGKTHYFHDFYAAFQATKRLSLMALADVGFQRNGANNGHDRWSSWVLIARYQLNDQWLIAGRAEQYVDVNGMVISSGSPASGFQTAELNGTNVGFDVLNYSLNLDYKPADNVLFRVEGRLFTSKEDIFMKEGISHKSSSSTIATSIALSW